MTWYAAHIIVSTRALGRIEGPISVYENVILVEANDPKEAAQKARIASAGEEVKDSSLTLDGVPAVAKIEGIRKLVTISNPFHMNQDEDAPVSGTEITYSEFIVEDEDALRDLVGGKDVDVSYLE